MVIINRWIWMRVCAKLVKMFEKFHTWIAHISKRTYSSRPGSIHKNASNEFRKKYVMNIISMALESFSFILKMTLWNVLCLAAIKLKCTASTFATAPLAVYIVAIVAAAPAAGCNGRSERMFRKEIWYWIHYHRIQTSIGNMNAHKSLEFMTKIWSFYN